MIYFDIDNYPTSLTFNPLYVAVGYSTVHDAYSYRNPVDCAIHGFTLSVETMHYLTITTGLINRAGVAERNIENAKEKLLLSEVGKFYYYGRKFLSFNAIAFMVNSLQFPAVNEAIYRHFNTNPELYAKILTIKVGTYTTTRLSTVNSLEQIYSLGICTESKQTLERIAATGLPRHEVRSAETVCKAKLSRHLPCDTWLMSKLYHNINFENFSSKRYTRAINLVTINKGLKDLFSYDSLGLII